MDDRLSTLRDSALDLYAAAREAGQYEVAYHALCGVLHAAESSRDLAALDLVQSEVQKREGRPKAPLVDKKG
jgi:hypothetical protein